MKSNGTNAPSGPSQKLVFVNRYFYPDHSATSQMLTDLAFGLSKAGHHDVHIVTSRQRYDDPLANLPAKETVDQIRIHRVWTSTFGRQNLLGRAMDYLSFYLAAFVELLKLTDAQTILIAKTDPPLISVVAAVAAKIKRATLINWIQDLFPEVASALGVRLAKGPLYTVLKALRNRSLHQAGINIVIGEHMQQRLRAEGIAEQKIAVIHNWTDDLAIRPVPNESNPLRNEWGLQGKFVVGYSGNLGRGHEFDTLLEAATALKDKPDIAFLFIGGGAGRIQLEHEARSRGLANIQFRPYQPRERLAESLSVADVHLVSLRPQLEGLIVPSKFYGIAAVARPVILIGDGNGQLGGMIQSGACGFAVAEGDHQQLTTHIRQIKDDPALAEKMGNNALALLRDKYTQALALAQWQRVLGDTAPNPTATTR